MRLLRSLAVIGTAFVVAAGFAYVVSGGVPTLRTPVRVVNASFSADGGSFHLVFRGSEGKEFAVGAIGFLDRAPNQFPIYTQRWWPHVPLPFYVWQGSSTERELLESLNAWSSEAHLTTEEREAMQSAAALLRSRAN